MSEINDNYIQRIKRYEVLFHAAENMIFFLEKDGRVCERNSIIGEQLGYGEDEELKIQDIFKTSMTVKNGKLELIDSEFGDLFETVVYRKNQTCLSVRAQVVLMDESTGCYAMCTAHNIVKQKETTKELISAKVEVKEVQKERNEFVANVTHELRTPVNGVMGLAQNLLEMELTSEQRESVEIIEQCCQNMIKIINNILDFSKLQSGKFTIENREFSFHKMMDSLVKVTAPQVEAKGVEFICNVAEDIPDKIIGDELRLTQVLNNFLSNAMKFTSVGKIVVNVVKTIDIDDTLELFFMVMDTGIGIAKDEMDKLFKSFSQVDASITRRFGGTGLGLSITKNLVEMMGGNINVESEKGKGSTFSFSVRLKKVSSDADGTPADGMVSLQAVHEQPQPEKTYSFNLSSSNDEEEETSEELYKLGSPENLKSIDENMEKLVICIEMENWGRADSFANNIKLLVAEDAMNLKRKAFRLQMTVRKGDHDNAIKQYEELKDAVSELHKSA